MEGFARDLKAQAGLILIYGDEGIGKTKLLEELAQTHLKDCKVRWMDLKAGSSGDGARVDSSVMIEKTFARAKPGDIIVADHFEMALKKTRHQLFLSWSTDGIDNQLSMIVAANTSYFNELRKLSQQYQIQVQSFQQLPFSDDEAAAFLGFYLFPGRPIGQLSVPPLLRSQLSLAQGRVGKIVEIAERAGDQISSLPINDNESIKQSSRLIVGVLIAVAVVVVTGWYFINSKAQIDEMTIAEPGSPLIGQQQEMPLSVESEVETDQAVDEVEAVEDGEVTNAEEASVDTIAASEVTPSGSSSGSVALSLFDRLQRDLQTSLEWINGRDISVGTLQILLLSQKGFKQRVYYEYLDRLAVEGVDLAELKIFETYTRGQRVFSVVFGEYPNRRSAADAKAELPKILRDASPIPRSVGGLMEEMRRLEGKN